jgi:hypothetical protein
MLVKKEPLNQEHIKILKESAEMWHFKSIQLIEQYKNMYEQTANQYEKNKSKVWLNQSKSILKLHEQYLKCTYDSTQNVSYDSLLVYEKLLTKKAQMNYQMTKIEDRTELGYWLKIVQLSKREHDIIVRYEPWFGWSTYCGFKRYRYQTEDSLKVNKPVNLLILEYSDIEHGFLNYSLGNIQTWMNKKPFKIQYEITKVNGITILRFIPNQSGQYTITVPLKFKDYPALNNTMLCEIEVRD